MSEVNIIWLFLFLGSGCLLQLSQFSLSNLATTLIDADLCLSPIESIQVHTGTTHLLATNVATFFAFHECLLLDPSQIEIKCFCCLYNVNNGLWADSLQILDEIASQTSVRIWRIDAFGGEVVQFLKVGIHHDLLLVGVFERFGTRDNTTIFVMRDNGNAALQTGNITS